MLHKAPAFCSKVELVFGLHGWLECVCAGVLGFIEFCIPTLHFWGRGVSNIGSRLIPVLFQLSFRGQSVADLFACSPGSWVKSGVHFLWEF